MKTIRNLVIFLILTLSIAYFTNPSFEEHKTKIETKFVEQNPISGFFGVGKIISNLVEYHDSIFFSYTTEKIKKNKLSFGFFGMVWVVDLDLNKISLDN